MRKLLLFCLLLLLIFGVFIFFQNTSDTNKRPDVISGQKQSDAAEVQPAQAPQYPESLISSSTNPEVPGTTVSARGLSVVPGAIICADHNTVGLMFDLYAQSWEENTQAALTHGQSELINGKATSKPDLSAYGCVLIPPGTPMRQETGNVVPVVDVKMADGNIIHGVTLDGMIASQTESSAPPNVPSAQTPSTMTEPDATTPASN